MNNEIVVNVQDVEKRIAIIENNKLTELLVEKEDQENIVGNIYKGKVKDVLPAMGAAFIEIGLNRTAFLHYSDIVTDFIDTNIKHRKATDFSRDSSKINSFLKPRQEIIVQVKKGPIGDKGARVTMQLSLPGKFLVLIPNEDKVAISRKISNKKKRKEIKKTIHEILSKDHFGIIARTSAQERTKSEFQSEYKNLKKVWSIIKKMIQHEKPPSCLYKENELLNILIKDLFNSSVDTVTVNNPLFKKKLISRLKETAPDLIKKVVYYNENTPIFDAFGIEKEIAKIGNRNVRLQSGADIVIEQTEAFVSIDINTGSYVGKSKYEDTIMHVNVEAATEIARQTRLRNLSGIIVVDFIDMRNKKYKQKVFSALKAGLKKDRAKYNIYPFDELGLVKIARKRSRLSYANTYFTPCPYCKGKGKILSLNSLAVKLSRLLNRAKFFIKKFPIRIQTSPELKEFLDKNPFYISFLHQSIEIVIDRDLDIHEFRVINLSNNEDITDKYNS